MSNSKPLFISLGIINLVALILGYFLPVISISILFLVYINRTIIYTIRANRLITTGEIEKGYGLLTKAYKSGNTPHVVLNGYIYLSIKYNYLDTAEEVINHILSGKVSYKLDDSKKGMIMVQKAVLLWCQNRLPEAIEILDTLYNDGYKTTTFYGNYVFLLYLAGKIEQAEKVGLEAYEYGKEDKVNLDNLVTIYLHKEDYTNAQIYFDQLEALKPTFAEAWYHGALLAIHNQDRERAEEYYENALEYELTLISSITKEDLNNLNDKISVMS